MSKKISIKINKNNFNDLINKIQDVSNINDVVKLKFNKDKILIYSMKSNDSAVLALKSYLLDTFIYFEDFTDDNSFDFVIINTPKFIKTLRFFDINTNIKLDIIYKPHYDNNEIMQIRSAQFTNGKLKISSIGGDNDKIRDLNADMLESRTDINNSYWNFDLSRQDFNDLKKLSSIDSEDSIITFNIENGKVVAEETSKWELSICQIDEKVNSKLVFNKKYLSNINKDLEIIKIYMFETFILIKDTNSNLMLSFEQSYEND